jgi:hypothetical protein
LQRFAFGGPFWYIRHRMGSVGVAAWIAHLVFWILVVWGWATESLSLRGAVIAVLLWVVPFLALDYLPSAAGFFSPYVAVIDIGLVFLLFRGDVRLT